MLNGFKISNHKAIRLADVLMYLVLWSYTDSLQEGSRLCFMLSIMEKYMKQLPIMIIIVIASIAPTFLFFYNRNMVKYYKDRYINSRSAEEIFLQNIIMKTMAIPSKV